MSTGGAWSIGLLLVAVAAWLPVLGATQDLRRGRRIVLASLRAAWLLFAVALVLGAPWPFAPGPRARLAVLEGPGAGEIPDRWSGLFQLDRVRVDPPAPIREPESRPRASDGKPPIEGPDHLAYALAELGSMAEPPDGILLLGEVDPGRFQGAIPPVFRLAARPDRAAVELFGARAPIRARAELPFEVTVRMDGSGCDAGSWAIRLIGPAGEEARALVPCGQVGVVDRTLRSLPPSPGVWEYRLAWGPLEAGTGETEERGLGFALHVEPAARVLVFEDAPGWEATFLRRSLERMPGVEPVSLARLAPDRFLQSPGLVEPGADGGPGAGRTNGFDLEALDPSGLRAIVMRAPPRALGNALDEALDVKQINEMLAKNIPLETLNFFTQYAGDFSETCGTDSETRPAPAQPDADRLSDPGAGRAAPARSLRHAVGSSPRAAIASTAETRMRSRN